MKVTITRAVMAATLLAASLGGFGYACVFSKTTSNKPDGSSSSGSGGSFDRNGLLRGLADNVLLPTLAEFVSASASLQSATTTYAETLDTVDREASQQAWREAMDIWQRAELSQFGPAGLSGVVAGGQDLRDEIYSWTLVNRCATDQVLTTRSYSDAIAFKQQLVNVRGLDALEYVLFNDGDSNACAPQVPINANGVWAAITDLPQRRADYAATLAGLVQEHAVTLHESWRPGGGNFAADLANAGQGSDTYASAQVALNGVSDAMFYLEGKTKDVKLAIPTGLSPDCAGDACPNDLELRFAGHSKAAIRQNILGFERLFLGGLEADALGFDDWLIALGAEDVAVEMRNKLQAAIDAVDAIEERTLTTAIADDPKSVENVYFAIKAVSDFMKSDFITVLDLELPKDVQGDDD